MWQLVYLIDPNAGLDVLRLFEQLVDVDTSGNSTALYLAAHNGHTNLVKLLLEYGADMLVADLSGATPLHIAALKGHREIVELLLNKKCNIEVQNNKGCTPLILAVEHNQQELALFLLERGAAVNVRATEGWTALHLAVQSGFEEMVELLLKHGASLNDAVAGVTVLHIAAQTGHTKVCEVLQKWMVRRKLCAMAEDSYNRVFAAYCSLKSFDINFLSAEVIAEILSARPLEFDVLCGASHNSSGNKFFQYVLRRASSLCGRKRAFEVLHLFAQECLNEAYTQVCDDGFTPAAYAQAQGHHELATSLTSGAMVTSRMIKLWIADEQAREGVITVPLPKKPEAEIKKCIACNKTGKLKRCGRCKNAYFCNVACQKKAWAEHQKDCKKA